MNEWMNEQVRAWAATVGLQAEPLNQNLIAGYYKTILDYKPLKMFSLLLLTDLN